MTMQNNPFLDFLEQDQGRRAAFFGAVPGFGRNPNQERFFTNRFQGFENRFLGALGRQIESGQAPTLKFRNFLSQNFDPFAELQRASPFETGRGTANLRSPGRFLFNL